MSRRGIFVPLLFLFLCSSLSVLAQKKPEPPKQQNSQSRAQEEANRAMKKWLEEDAAYIIVDEERAAFKKLSTDEEREQFIEQFWLRRDPTPDSIENEYQEDHYARIAYANERFASGIPGWRTDRGRVYIIHGKPAEIESHAGGGYYERPLDEGGGSTSTYPFEIWRYRYIEGMGNDILFEFVDNTMTGEYHLSIDPNEKDALLMVPGAGLTLDEQINGRDKADRFNVADRDTGTSDSLFGRSIRTNQFERLNLYNNAFRPPEIKFKDLEAIISTKLSFNLLPFDLTADFVRVTDDTVLTPITIRLKYRDMAFQEQEGIHRALANVFLRITGINGRPAGTLEHTIQADIPASLFAQTLERDVFHQEIIPLRPGRYKMEVVIKDMHSNNVGTLSQALTVPRYPEGNLSTSSMILADLIESVPLNQVGSGPFVLGNTKVRPNVKDEFTSEQDLKLWLQVYNLKVDEQTHKPSARVETLITRNGQEVRKIVEESRELSGAAQQMTVVQSTPLKDFAPGAYAIQVKITDNLSKEVVASTGKFTIR